MRTLRPRYRQQTGSVLVQFALLLGVIVAILGIIDLGYMFYAKRELQRNADLSALQAVQRIDFMGTANQRALSCEQAGHASVNANWPSVSPITPISKTITCGEWDAVLYPGPQHFRATSGDVNAALVVLEGKSPTFFPGPWSRVITAQAIAKRAEPLAVFSVGSKLVAVGCRQELAPLVQLLKIVGVGDPCVTVNGYEGLANASISASGLLQALGLPLDASLSVVDVNNLLVAEKVSLGDVLDAAATLGGHSELLGVNAELLRVLGAKLGIDALNLEVPLFSGPDGPGIFASVHAPDQTQASALDVQVKVIDIITAAVGVGTTGRGVSVPGLEIMIPGILPNLLKVQLGITEPPSVAIGGVGATAYNAQIRLYIDVDTRGGVLGGLLQLLGTTVKLPIFLDVTRAQATLTELQCKIPVKESTVKVKADASIAQACIGKVSGDPFSIRTPVCDSLENETLVSALGLIKIHNRVKTSVLKEPVQFSPSIQVGETWSFGNQLNLGTTLSELIHELLRLLGELLGAPTSGSWTPAENVASAQKMANYYLGIGSEVHPNGAIPKDQTLGTLGPSGVYDVVRLRDRLKTEINRSSQSCLLLQILCWQNNEWNSWASDIQSANIASGRACWGSTPEGFVTVGAAGNATDVTQFNQCVERELKEAMLEAPNSKPNYLQVLFSPLTELLKALLDPIGNLLAGPVLRDLLGIELGVNDVHVKSIGCSGGELVY